jgi:hypothetical protein
MAHAAGEVTHLRLAVAGLALIVAACAGPALAPTAPATVGPTGTPSGDPTDRPAATPALSSATPTAQPTSPPTNTPTPTPATPAGPLRAAAWSELASAVDSPEPREDHTWTVAGNGNEAYLFGGRAGRTEFNDLWRYDLVDDAWQLVTPAGDAPAARFGHVAAWADGIGLVIWSGQAGPRFFNDTWVYDPDANSWRQLPAAGDIPPARYGSCGGIGPDGRLWISHGFTEDTGRFADTRAYDFSTGIWTDLTPAGDRPVERCLHDCLWTPDGALLLYAGQTTGAPAIGDLWLYEPQAEEWAQQAQPEPLPRQLYAVALVGDTIFVFGGGARDGTDLDDLWQLELDGMTWREAQPAGVSPAGRFGATLIADDQRNRLMLFGGKRGTRELADLWQLQLADDQ